MSTTYTLSNRDGDVTLSVFADNFEKVLTSEHPLFNTALEYLTSTPVDQVDQEHLRGLVDPSIGIGKVLKEALGDRLTFDLHNLYLDGLPVQGALAAHLKQKMLSGDVDYVRVARFLVNLEDNPSYKARTTLWTWVERHGATITEDGCLLGFKGLNADMTSRHSGPNNFINGVLYGVPGDAYNVPHEVGTVISKRRGDVDDSRVACSTGLHVGSFNYARSFVGITEGTEWKGSSVLAIVKFNPRDVVSPSDQHEKIRVCSYEVVEVVEDASDILTGRTSYDAHKVAQAQKAAFQEAIDADLALLDDEERAVYDQVRADGGSHNAALEGVIEAFQPRKVVTLEDWAARLPDLKDDLHNRSLGHKPLARKWAQYTTESSVRRYRKAHDVKVSLGARLQG